MTQERAQEIIRTEYGNNAVAVGHSTTPGGIVILWVYRGEDWEDYREHMTAEN